jgi:uncharacterized protein YcaQ
MEPGDEEAAAEVLEFIRAHGPTHPRAVDAEFAHGRTTNAWGGSSNSTTHLLDGMHYRGLLRVARREAGIRIYEAAEHPPAESVATPAWRGPRRCSSSCCASTRLCRERAFVT